MLFTDDFVGRPNDRNKQDDMRAMGNLCRFHDIKYDTNLHEEFTSWLKKKEVKWVGQAYHFPKEQLPLEKVLYNISKLDTIYSDFAKFMLTSGLRTHEAIIVFENHKKFCHNGILEIFWNRKTKNTNATYCLPTLHEKMDRKLRFDYDHFKELGCELRYLRKLNFTMNATKLDPLLAEFIQGRRGNVSQRHYFLPLLNQNQPKWNKIWSKIIKLVSCEKC